METKIFRLLTWKSKLGFGKYSMMTIEQIYLANHTFYLRWIYYNFNELSFIDDILNKIGVITNFRDNRIKKPGIDKLLCEEVNNFYRKFMIEQGYDKIIDKQFTDKAKKKLKDIEEKEKIEYSKKNLQWKNQGHKTKK